MAAHVYIPICGVGAVVSISRWLLREASRCLLGAKPGYAVGLSSKTIRAYCSAMGSFDSCHAVKASVTGTAPKW